METVLKMYQLNPAPAENLIRQVETFNPVSYTHLTLPTT